MKPDAQETAIRFVGERFPEAGIVFLSGSTVLGRETPHSDLDLVIFDETWEFPVHMTFLAYGWKIEAFIFTRDAAKEFFAESVKTGLPTLLRMCATGVLIRDRGGGEEIRRDAQKLFQKGPAPWTLDELEQARYEITELLEDLEGASSLEESYYVMHGLANRAIEFLLRTNEKWTGDGKWMIRSLKEFSEPTYREWTALLESFYKKGEKVGIVRFVDSMLEPYGGRLVDGYYARGGQEFHRPNGEE